MNKREAEHGIRTLEKVGVGVCKAVAGTMLGGVDWSVARPEIQDALVLTIRGHIFAENMPGHTVEYPEDWWQAFKDRWFPSWAKKRCPVRLARETVDFRVTYPGFLPAIDGHEYRVAALHTKHFDLYGDDHEA